MAGDDEARARAVLAEMQLRISQGPTSALGIGEIVTPEEVRAAFLGLTKQFHPARFGRLAPDLQKLANEVFLGIKAAHDHMLKVLGSSTAASRSTGRPSSGVPIVGEGTNRTPTPHPRGTQSMPRLDASGRAASPLAGARPATPAMGVPISRTATPASIDGRHPTGQMPPLARPETPAQGTHRSTGSIPRQGTPQPTTARTITPVPPGTQPGVMPTGQVPRQPTPPGTQHGVMPTGQVPRQPTPSAGTQPLARPGTPPPNQAGGTQPTPRTPVPPGTQPGVAPSAGSQRMVRVKTATGSIINVPANQVTGTRPPTLKPGETSPLAPRPPTLKPGETSPLAPRPATLKPGETSPLATRPITLKPGETSPLAPTQPARPVTLKPGETSPLTPPTQPPGAFNPPTVRNVTAPSAELDEAAAFREAAQLMEQKNWTAARQALHALAARVPQSKTYRAWLCYARGREAYLQGRPDDAILEMQRALQLEPDLAHAKHALAELQRRR